LVKISLFAQPADFEPVLKLERDIYPAYSALDEGKGVHLNDVGKAAWVTALKLYPRVSLRLETYESPGYEWAITLLAPSMTLIMKSVGTRKKPVLPLRNPRHFVVALEIRAGHLASVQFAKRFVEQLGRDPWEMAEPEDFTAASGVTPADAAGDWRVLLAVDIATELRALYAEVRKEIAESESRGLKAVDQARGLMIQAEGAIEEEKYDLTMSVLETARGILKDAQSLARQEEHQREMAADMISFVQTIILKASKAGMDTARAQKLLTGAAQAFSEQQDGEGAVKLAMQARSLIELESRKREKAESALKASGELIEDARENGLDIAHISQLEEKAGKALSGHNYGMVGIYASAIRKAVTKLKKEHQLKLDKKEAVEYAISACQLTMKEAQRFDCDMSGCSDLVTRARVAIEAGELDSALEMAETGRALAEEAMRYCAEAMDSVQQATTAVKDAAAFIDTRRIEPYLDRAWVALKRNDYREATGAATLSRDMVEASEVEAEPRIDVNIRNRDLKPGLWNRAQLDILNTGVAHARNIAIKFSGLIEASRLRKILFLRAGEGYTLEVGLKPAGAGELAYDIETGCKRAFDGVGYSSRAHRWLKVAVDPGTNGASADEAEGDKAAPAAPPRVETEAATAIEEVYVVFHDGRLIFHDTRRDRQDVDEMSLSSLLTAVQNFIKDSFKYDEGGLGKLEWGKLKMVLEHGRLIYIAVVLSGGEPPALRTRMRRIIEDIERTKFDSSGIWDGNMTTLEDTHPQIEKLFDLSTAGG
jgi:hypothetical protein